MNHAIAWHADGDRFLILQNAPAEHGEILLAGGWSQIDEPRNAAEHRNIEKADVGDVVHRVHSASYHVDYGWVGIDAEYGYEAKYKVMHQGEKVAIIAAGSFYQKGENVVRLLADKGIDATLINPRYLNEVDAETLDSLKANHQLVVTLEDGSKDGGFGERIASYYGTSEMKVMVDGIRKGLYDRYDVQQLLSDNRLLDEQIVEDVLLVIND